MSVAEEAVLSLIGSEPQRQFFSCPYPYDVDTVLVDDTFVFILSDLQIFHINCQLISIKFLFFITFVILNELFCFQQITR